MAIDYTSSDFIVTTSTPAFQNWESPTPTNFIYIQTGGAVIYPAIVPVKFKDYIGTVEGLNYSEFRIKANKFYTYSSFGSNWLIASSVFFEGNLQGSPITKQLISDGFNIEYSKYFNIECWKL